MELEQIRELIGLMKENDLSEVRIIEGEKRLLLKRGKDQAPVVSVAPVATVAAMPAVSAPAPATTQAAAPAAPKAEGPSINSPMVGTFYSAPAPDAEPYVRVGDHVNPDSVVCIVEAMKVMNEIKAEMAGTIERIAVKNGQAVEFGQPLFSVKPD